MVKYAEWLSQRKALNLVIVLAYSVFILIMHNTMARLSKKIMEYYSWQNYDIIVATLAGVFMTGVLYFFVKKLLQYRHATKLKVTYLTIFVLLLAIHIKINLVLNIELIHMLEFGILALLVFPLTQRFGDTAFYTLLVAIADELYQYLAPDPTVNVYNKYFDFNDLVLDMLGVGLALVLLYAAGVNHKSYPPRVKWYHSPLFYLTVVISVTLAALYQFSLIQTYGSSTDAWFILNKAEGPQSFLVQDGPGSPIIYHIMQPLEGVAVLLALMGLFFLLDYLARRKVTGQLLPYH